MPQAAILSAQQRKSLVFAGTVCVIILALGSLFAPERVWSNLLIGTFGLLTVGLGGAVFLALTFVSGAGWHVAFRRVPESMAMIVPAAGIAMLVVLALRMREYGWHHHGAGSVGTFWFKEFWLTPWFWLLRSVFYVALWSLLGGWLVHRSRAQDVSSICGAYLAGNVRLSALFLAVYAVTFSLASADWIMALEPMWFSTMWGVYNFAGMIQAALAVVVVLCIMLSSPGHPLHGVFSTEHLHDLGRLLVGFSCFWMYVWFSQYMLIWYANIPEETTYFIARTHGPWGPIVVLTIVLNWVVPFFALLPRSSKRSRGVMGKVAIVILIGRWTDLYVMIFPAIFVESPAFGIWELVAIIGTVTSGLCLADRAFLGAKSIPENDPFLAESLKYHAT